MTASPVVNGKTPDSPHVLSGTNVNRGATPATWSAIGPQSVRSPWEGINPGGPADFSGETTRPFDSGPGRWMQT